MKLTNIINESYYANHNKEKADFQNLSAEEKRQHILELAEQRGKDPLKLAVSRQRSHRVKDNSYVIALLGDEAYEALQTEGRIARFKNGQLTVLDQNGKPYSGF